MSLDDQALEANVDDILSRLENTGVNDKREIQELQEKLAHALNERGFSRYLKVDFEEAEQDFTLALRYNSNLAVAYYNRGLIHYRLGRFADAVLDMDRALQCQPDFTSAQQCKQQAIIDGALRDH